MIRAVMVMNTQGKLRLAKFYDYQPVEKQQELIRSIFGVLCSRAENVSNFIEAESIFGPDTRLVYKHYATLYFVFVFDSSENELAVLDLIQVFVETLDKCFKNVCELDIIFNFNKMHTILDEIVLGGQVLETSAAEVMKAIDEITTFSLSLSMLHSWYIPLSLSLPLNALFLVYPCAGWRNLQTQQCSFRSPYQAGWVDKVDGGSACSSIP